MSVLHFVTVNLLTLDLGNVLNGRDLYRVGLCLAGVMRCQYGTRPCVSMRVTEGALHQSA